MVPLWPQDWHSYNGHVSARSHTNRPRLQCEIPKDLLQQQATRPQTFIARKPYVYNALTKERKVVRRLTTDIIGPQ